MSDDGSRKTALVVGAVALAAGLAVASYVVVLRMRAARGDGQPLRTVRDVLSDCYARMRELQDNINDLAPTAIPQPQQ